MSKDCRSFPFDFGRGFGRMGFPPFRPFRHLLIGSNVTEGLEDITITIPLPGYTKDDIELRVGPDTLIIGFKEKEPAEETERKEEKEEHSRCGPWWLHTGPHPGSVRRLPLPAEVDPDTAKAKLENGILKITIRKKSPENEKSVPIE